MWGNEYHFTAVGASSMRSAKVEFRANGGEILHQTQFRFAVAVIPEYASMSAGGCQLACGPSAVREVGMGWSPWKAIKKTRGRDCGTKCTAAIPAAPNL